MYITFTKTILSFLMKWDWTILRRTFNNIYRFGLATKERVKNQVMFSII
jgi:hypothetical protein